MHRLGAVAHKSSTCLCTDSREAVVLSAGRQQRIGTGRRYPQARPTRRVRASETRWCSCRVRTAVRRCRAHVVRRWDSGREPGRALVGTDMIKVLPNPNHYPLPMAGEFYAIYWLLRVFMGRLAQNLDICAMRANSQS
jgi:hypothetical protein